MKEKDESPDGADGRRRVGLLSAGGTIATQAASEADLVEYGINATRLDSETLLQTLPYFNGLGDVVPVPFETHRGPSVRMNDVAKLARTIVAASEELDLHAIVVAHGTATLEETAFLLTLWLDNPIPIVVVGAQRPQGALSSDAPIALIHAVLVARHLRPDERCVVMNGEVHDTLFATKESTYGLDAMRTDLWGPVGRILPTGRVVMVRRPRLFPQSLTLPYNLDREAWPVVPIMYGAMDMHAGEFDTSIGEIAGIVSAAMAPGFMSDAQEQMLDRIRAAGAVEIRSVRRGIGPVIRDARLAGRHIVAGGFLDPHRCRLLAMSLLPAPNVERRAQMLLDQLSGFDVA